MEFFPDGAFVRLQSRVLRTYLHADEDGVSLTMSPERASLHAAWRVHQIDRNGIPYVLLYNAAYGRYLAATNRGAAFGLRGQRVVQGYYDELEDNSVVWVPNRVVNHTAGDDRDRMVFIQHVPGNRLLRCNGKYLKLARYGVSVDSFINLSQMMHWVVETIPPLPPAPVPVFPPSQAAPAHPPPRPQPRRGIISLFRRWRSEPTTYRRTIRFVRPDDAGSSNDQGWQMIQFEGRSAYTLRMEVTGQRREHYLGFKVTLCPWGGRYGRLTPLTADLPRNQEPMAVVVLTVGSPVEVELRYPNVDEP